MKILARTCTCDTSGNPVHALYLAHNHKMTRRPAGCKFVLSKRKKAALFCLTETEASREHGVPAPQPRRREEGREEDLERPLGQRRLPWQGTLAGRRERLAARRPRLSWCTVTSPTSSSSVRCFAAWRQPSFSGRRPSRSLLMSTFRSLGSLLGFTSRSVRQLVSIRRPLGRSLALFPRLCLLAAAANPGVAGSPPQSPPTRT